MEDYGQNEYYQQLKKRQEEHLANVYDFKKVNWRPCMHDACTECYGTGVKFNGSTCIHGISCPCPRCSPSF